MTLLSLKHPFVVLMALIGFCTLAVTAAAQDETLGTLTIGQPVISEITADSTFRYAYTLAEASIVTFQAVSETAQPTITILSGDEVVASEPNADGKFVTSLTTMLTAGDYVIEMGAANNAAGSILLVAESAVPVSVNELSLASPVSSQLSADTPIALYRFTALNEPSLIFISSAVPTSGVEVHLFNETLDRESGVISSELLGGMLHIPANSANYRLEIEYSTLTPADLFTLCWVTASAGSCGGKSIIATPEQPANPTAVLAACTVTPANGAVNVRSSASTVAPVIAPLKVGETANVIGISPDGDFYNIQFGSVIGWVARSVVTTSGDCSSVGTVTPPDFVPVATQAPTLPPLPTATATSPATQPPTATHTPSGPCLLTLNSPVKVYTEPIEKVDFLYDQLQSGELIPIGRLADGSWWKTNYASSWVPTYLFGGAITVSGNCALPVVTP